MVKSGDKIVTRSIAAERIKAIKGEGKVVGFTSGVFDLIHPGHVQYLEDARARCDFLVVGINSDLSVRHLKGATRPICAESDRVRVIAGLESVDLVFIFPEENNNQNVKELSPSIYFKAGDYKLESLSSKKLVEEGGGKVELVPFVAGRSSTGIIEKIAHLTDPAFAAETLVKKPEVKPAVFLDRDGTINVLKDYLSEVSGFELIPGALDALKMFQTLGYRIIITTNQPGIGLGYFSREDMYRIHSHLLTLASKSGIMIDKIYFCPHSDVEACNCRKPKPGMIERAVSELGVDLSKSFVIGDMTSDIQFGKNANCKTILVKTGKGGSDKKFSVEADFTAPSLLEAAQLIANQKKS